MVVVRGCATRWKVFHSLIMYVTSLPLMTPSRACWRSAPIPLFLISTPSKLPYGCPVGNSRVSLIQLADGCSR
ncbi:hypothetical protein N658DRAFT_4129 [Parathielavia hyrcaniae]|uniref:Secreted protein n=1 Tax=Parathielavia hyrcaniae TaxID=113614 RepID=A0AAN6Q9E6_9PEZI|nr:hypothetical protein N658DRAFT_4129 [Parathielavia hyrcaniae]